MHVEFNIFISSSDVSIKVRRQIPAEQYALSVAVDGFPAEQSDHVVQHARQWSGSVSVFIGSTVELFDEKFVIFFSGDRV